MTISSRLAALAAGSSLALTGVIAAPASAAPDASPVNQGVSWLAKQDFFSPGARIDALQQLVLLGRVNSPQAQAQLTAIKAGAADYATSAEASAKVSFAGDLVDQDAGTWGAGDLVTKAADGVDDTTGRIEGDYVTPASQALAVRALGTFAGRTAHAEYAAARDYLLTQQCENGRFRDALAATSCDADDAAGSADATAFVVLYLAGSDDATVTASLGKARTWLVDSQLGNGSWQSPDQPWGPGTPNANSTGLAALALGESPEATKAAAWLRRLQARDAGACTSGIAGKDKGAIAFTRPDYTAGREAGLDEGQFTRSSWVYATQQSLAAMQWAPEVPGTLKLDGPTKFLRAGSTQKLTASNVADVSRACLTGPETKQVWQATAAASIKRTVTLPATTGNRTYRLRDSAGRTATHVLKVLGTKTFKVTLRDATVKTGKTQRVVVTGLAPRERVIVLYDGKRIRTAKASKTGTSATNLPVGSQVGRHKVGIRGEFADIRKGTAFFQVVR